MDCPTCGKSLSTERGMRQHHTKVHDDPLPNRECADCGDDFYDPKSRRTYCEACHSESGAKNGNYSGAEETAECERCGDEFEYYPSNKEGVYCSTCVAGADGLLPEAATPDASWVEVNCAACGTELLRYPCEVEAAERGCFCDLDCYGDWLSENVVGESHHQWEGGDITYGESWWTVRRAALHRDGYECQRCGAGVAEIGRNPDVHHIDPVRTFDNPEAAHQLDNVVSLCRSCHRRVEAGEAALPSG
jgi:hypothetical protein